MRRTEALLKISEEFDRATSIHGCFASTHEGYAVLLEEVEQLRDVIKDRNHDKADLEKEATQVADMALRFLVDLT